MDIRQILESIPDSTESAPVIRLDQMPQQSEVREPEDDWTGLNNAKERRKLQNRLNQRLWRKRQRAKKTKPGPSKAPLRASSISSSPSSESVTPPLIEGNLDLSLSPTSEWDESDGTMAVLSNPPPISTSQLCKGSPAAVQDMLTRFETWAHQNYLLGSPRVDLLLTLVQFNVFRALLSNTSALGFDMEWLVNEDAISPFNTTSPQSWDILLPEFLRPTELQHKVEHHPWIDLFPIPAMRDNLLRKGASYDDSDICFDVVEVSDKPKEKAGLIVWGEPCNIYAWEASSEFLRKWGWLVEGCHELLQSTNYWRTQRGERIIEL